MSVPSWERELSKTQYIYEAYKLCIDIGHIVASQPKKYRQNYGDMLIHDSLECLKFCKLANSVFMSDKTSESERQRRRTYLFEARTLAGHISTEADVFFGLCLDVDGARREKIERQQLRIGTAVVNLTKLISGVLKHDKEMVTS